MSGSVLVGIWDLVARLGGEEAEGLETGWSNLDGELTVQAQHAAHPGTRPEPLATPSGHRTPPLRRRPAA